MKPAKGCKLPKMEKQEVKILPEDKAKPYLMVADKRGLVAAYYLELTTDLRRGELPGLRWADLDKESRCIHINQGLAAYHSVDEDKLVLESSGLKNKFLQRAVPITDDSLWKRLCQAPRMVAVGKRTVMTEYIFHSPEGNAYQPNDWANRVLSPL